MKKIDLDKVIEILDESKSIKAAKTALIIYVENLTKNIENKSEFKCFCRLHNRLEPYENMVIDSYGKSKGVCKAGQWRWQIYYRNICQLSKQRTHQITNKDFQLADETTKQIENLKRKLNSVISYDYDKDWTEYFIMKK